MAKPDIKLMRVGRGFLAYYTLDELTKRQKNADPSEWGICGAECDNENFFWLSKRVVQSGEDVLRLPLSKILEMRNELHPSWGDEELYVFVGIQAETGRFVWSLTNEEEATAYFARAETEVGPCLN